MSLESWASGNDGEVLIISQDQGWEKFAEQSSVLHCGPSIAEALSALYESQPLLINEIILLIQGDAFEGVEAGLGVAIESLIVSADANSFGHTDVDILDLSLRSLLVDSLHPSDLVVIERTVDHVTVQCRLVAALDISAMVDIGVYDSVDKDYVFLDGGKYLEQIKLI